MGKGLARSGGSGRENLQSGILHQWIKIKELFPKQIGSPERGTNDDEKVGGRGGVPAKGISISQKKKWIKKV